MHRSDRARRRELHQLRRTRRGRQFIVVEFVQCARRRIFKNRRFEQQRRGQFQFLVEQQFDGQQFQCLVEQFVVQQLVIGGQFLEQLVVGGILQQFVVGRIVVRRVVVGRLVLWRVVEQ